MVEEAAIESMWDRQAHGRKSVKCKDGPGILGAQTEPSGVGKRVCESRERARSELRRTNSKETGIFATSVLLALYLLYPVHCKSRCEWVACQAVFPRQKQKAALRGETEDRMTYRSAALVLESFQRLSQITLVSAGFTWACHNIPVLSTT